MIENAPLFVALVDRTGTIEYFSRYLPGFTPDMVLGKSIFDFVPPERREDARHCLDQVIGRNESRLYETSIENFDGTAAHYETHVSPVVVDGEIIGATLISRNVTERVAAQREVEDYRERLEAMVEDKTRELIEKERRFRTILDHAQDSIVICDPGGRFLDVNEAACTASGYSRSELLRMTALDMAPDLDARMVTAAYETVIREGSVRMETISRRKDGSLGPVEITIGRSRVGSEDIFVAVVRDIAERKRAEESLRESEARLRASEEKFAKAFQGNPMPAAITRPSPDVFVEVNGAFLETFGYRRDEVIGKTSTDLGIFVNASQVRVAIKRLAEQGAFRDVDVRTKDGCIRHGVFWGELIRIQEEPFVLTVMNDVTERRQADEMQRARTAAEAANQAKTRFLANLSHELRTPLTAMLGTTEMALLEDISPAVRGYLVSGKQSAETLLEMLNEILDFARTESGKLSLECSPFSLTALLDQVAKTLGLRAYEKGLELICDPDPEVPDRLIGDPLRLRQVLTNLIGNAIKFTREGEVTVRVRQLSRSNEEAVLEFSVADTGIGIAPADQERIFSPFVQADPSNTRQFGGTGLGLAIAANLVQLMRGRIEVKSHPEQGSTFTFTAALRFPPDAEETKKRPPSFPTLRNLPVLIVDDNAASCRLLETLLQRWGMRPVSVCNVPAALARIRQATDSGQPFSVALIDAMMPGADGFSLADWIQRHPDSVGAPVLLISLADRQTHLAKCRELDAVWTDKPISPSNLLDAIVRAASRAGLVTHSDSNDPPSDPAESAATPLQVLLVEDTPISRDLIAGFLTKRGHSAAVACNGREAVDRVRKESFDVVLMDIQMPTMDGFQATAAIRALERAGMPHVPIIAMTAHALQGDREKCLAAGMDGYLSKPIRPRQLFEAIERLAIGHAQAAPTPLNETAAPASGNPFSLDEAMLRCCNREMFLKMADFFMIDAPDLLERAREALAQEDLTEAAHHAHRIKGTVFYLGARSTIEAATAVEHAMDAPTAQIALQGLEAKITALKNALKPFLKRDE